MIKVTIRGEEYSLKNAWDDVSLKLFQELCRINIPKKLRQRYEALLSGNEELYNAIEDTHREIVKTYPEYYGQVIQLLSDIPKEVVRCMEWSIRSRLFNEYLLHMAETTLSPQPLDMTDKGIELYTPLKPYAFVFQGEQYYLPVSLMYGGNEIPLSKEKIRTFAEASDIDIALNEWAEKGIEGLAQVCAVYLRKEGEDHSDELVLERTEKFKELPMSVVWEVFFCIMQLGQESKDAIQSSLTEVEETAVRQQSRAVLQASE